MRVQSYISFAAHIYGMEEPLTLEIAPENAHDTLYKLARNGHAGLFRQAIDKLLKKRVTSVTLHPVFEGIQLEPLDIELGDEFELSNMPDDEEYRIKVTRNE